WQCFEGSEAVKNRPQDRPEISGYAHGRNFGQESTRFPQDMQKQTHATPSIRNLLLPSNNF
ncbi:hypothetical protein JW979_15790, partial [bacterium]|nr:hypothetical protein [candidate division CSSED10-310 bacterium]